MSGLPLNLTHDMSRYNSFSDYLTLSVLTMGEDASDTVIRFLSIPLRITIQVISLDTKTRMPYQSQLMDS